MGISDILCNQLFFQHFPCQAETLAKAREAIDLAGLREVTLHKIGWSDVHQVFANVSRVIKV